MKNITEKVSFFEVSIIENNSDSLTTDYISEKLKEALETIGLDSVKVTLMESFTQSNDSEVTSK